ncbi:hypothetical protein L2E82_10657 [Cichorium intybus]|uniref:Uncharacterized protein n=1 Tax=Cichorium intybus TaxID=13427 RepID=A0ACB9GCD9_CICIN|nr:hypothetical protein L2E82_10657 [Cichorium intybus]
MFVLLHSLEYLLPPRAALEGSTPPFSIIISVDVAVMATRVGASDEYGIWSTDRCGEERRRIITRARSEDCLSILSPERSDIVLAIHEDGKPKGPWVTLKEGCGYSLRFSFQVSHNIVSGLMYTNNV